MRNVFQKFLKKELGNTNYHQYITYYRNMKTPNDKELKSFEIYQGMYEQLKDHKLEILQNKMEQLKETLLLSLKINKQYGFIFVCYIVSIVVLVMQNLLPMISIVAIGILSVVFLYKTYEFVINKYCYIDAYLILVYKNVLDSLLFTTEDMQL